MNTRIVGMIIWIALPFICLAQDGGEKNIARKDVPAAVLAAFAKAYPKATIQGYSTEMDRGRRVYEVESREGKTDRDVTYAADGSLLVVEETVPSADVPEPVRASVARDFPKLAAARYEKVTEGSVVRYEVHGKSAGKRVEREYAADGTRAPDEKR